MDKTAHIVIGFISVAIASLVILAIFDWPSLLDIKMLIVLAAIAYIYSLLPDIDHPISTITWNFLGIGIIGLVASFFIYGQALLLFSIGLLILTFLCAQFAGHRGPIHTVWAGAIFTLPIYFIFSDWRLCLIAWIAYYSHLVADGYFFKV